MRLQGDELHVYLERYADEIANGIWKQECFYIGKYIPEKKLRDAEWSYAELAEDEIPLLLYEGTLYGDDMEGMLLTTQSLHYYAIISLEKKANDMLSENRGKYNSFDNDEWYGAGGKHVINDEWYSTGDVKRGKGSIPLAEIGTLSFKPGKLNIKKSAVPGTILYMDSLIFAYFLNQSRSDIDVLNDLFGKLNNDELFGKLNNDELFGRQDIIDSAAPEPLPEPQPGTAPGPVWALEREEIIYEPFVCHIGCFADDINGGKYYTYITNARIVRISSGTVKISGKYNEERFFTLSSFPRSGAV